LTLLAEHRTQSVPRYETFTTMESDETADTIEASIASHSNTTTSIYAELRSRLFGAVAPASLLRELELQLAVRHDEEKGEFARDPQVPDPEFLHPKFAGTAYTVGAKTSPLPWLMLRASYATGEQPPPLYTLTESDPELITAPLATDPRRGDTDLGVDGDYLLEAGGNADLRAVSASTAALGAVLTPAGADGPRVAFDYSRIRRTRDVLSLSPADIMAHEDFWSGRVTRAPLTGEDRANGYSAGRVTVLDMRVSNGAELEVDAVDLHLNWPLTFLGGRLDVHADATRHIRNVQKAPFRDDVNFAGYRDGPLKRRANAGFDWSIERLTIGANLQYFGSSLIFQQGPRAGAEVLNAQIQGAERIPSQSYLDLRGSWRPPVRDFGRLDRFELDLGIVNVLDKAPPRESVSVFGGPGYSRYGDPRQRRFELGVSLNF
jgi:outer membrane receptor protein involved in Fe transport